MKAIIIDDDQQYRRELKARLTSLNYDVEETNDVEEAQAAAHSDLIVLDDFQQDGHSYWTALLKQMRSHNPDALILLVSGYSDAELAQHVDSLNPMARRILSCDPFVQYLPKGTSEEELVDHYSRVKKVAEQLRDSCRNRHDLQYKLIKCAFDAAHSLRRMPLEELAKPARGKADTMEMDVVAERQITSTFVYEMHRKHLLICTEEAGLHNKLYHRVHRPEFFLFSDPFDGSSAFKWLLKAILTNDDTTDVAKELLVVARETGINGKSTLTDVAKTIPLRNKWDSRYGYHTLNAPMVSMVLAERHRVVGAVLINLFTLDTYISLDEGNYWKCCSENADDELPSISKAIEEAHTPEDWNRLTFQRFGDISGSKLFVGTLSAVKRTKTPPEITCHNAHASTCLGPILRPILDWEGSFQHRLEQHDFTPGPGRVLFLTNCAPAANYNEHSLNGSAYRSILSAGEPFTEWIGWLAFLRHAPGLSAYCLRRTGEISGHCNHRRHADDPATLLPDELASIFREGHLDLTVLHTVYGANMHRYNDTVCVMFDDDEDWKRSVKDKSGEDLFIRIPLFQNQMTLPEQLP